ncbi:MAG: hypothetical protein M3Z56_09855 [Bacteroidota bacterium]|nr:hypothetical protein [Bacteroidota bacterium]
MAIPTAKYKTEEKQLTVRCTINHFIQTHLVPTSNNIRDGENDFSWYSNNLPAEINVKDVTVHWVFGNRWNPEKI